MIQRARGWWDSLAVGVKMIVVLLVILSVLAACSNGVEQAEEEPASEPATEDTQETTEGAATTDQPSEESIEGSTEGTRPDSDSTSGPEGLAVGESTEAQGVQTTLNGVRTLPVTEFDQPFSSANNLFVAVDMTFENTSDEPVSLSSLLELTLRDEDGYSADQYFHTEQRQLPEGNIAPGQRASGDIVYEVSADSEGLQLSYNPFLGRETYIWSIGSISSTFGTVNSSESGSAPQEQPDASTEDGADSFISSYYEAVSLQDWQATYSLLDSESQAVFTEGEWTERQITRNAAAASPPVTSAVVNSTGQQGADQISNVTLYYGDGSQETLDVVIRSEDGVYKRHLTDEEIEFLQSL